MQKKVTWPTPSCLRNYQQLILKNINYESLTITYQLRVLDGFILYLYYIYYDITMRLVCDYYVIPFTSPVRRGAV